MKLEAIVVLGCVLQGADRLGSAAARRVERAHQAYVDGVADHIVVSGGRRWFGVSEAEAYRSALIARGVPAERILMELCSFSTAENAGYCAELLRQHGWHEVGVVTCDWHMRRALACFRQAEVKCRALPASSPPLGLLRRVRRGLKERASALADRAFTVGF